MTLITAAFLSEFGGIAIAGAFFIVFCLLAYIAFRLLKRSAKIAVRLLVVLVILAVAASGSLALYSFLKTPAKPATKSRSTRER
ncbi:MAG: hypothetical protein R2682_04790 [Pyrinomonadaceae bacterium]